jgi:hypothetical protein
MFGGASTALTDENDTRFTPDRAIRPFSYPPKTS